MGKFRIFCLKKTTIKYNIILHTQQYMVKLMLDCLITQRIKLPKYYHSMSQNKDPQQAFGRDAHSWQD